MKNILIALPFLLSGLLAGAQLTPTHLLCENLRSPIAIDAPQPRFSWQLEAPANRSERSLSQLAYEIRVAPDNTSFGNNAALTWSSGKVTADQSVHVLYAGQPLQSAKRY